MIIQLNFWPTLAFVVMALSWLAFVIAFFFHKKPPSPPDKKRDPSSITGIVLQGVSYGIVWSIRRTWFTPMFPNRSLGQCGFVRPRSARWENNGAWPRASSKDTS